jgi:hypothetical protein
MQYDVSSFKTSKYEKMDIWLNQTNKAKQSQISLNQLLGFILSLQSAKMARKLTSKNPQNNTCEKYNCLQIKMLNDLSPQYKPTGTPFAYLIGKMMNL